MTKLLHKLLNNLCAITGADMSCLIKFDQNTFQLIDYYSVNPISFEFSSIVKNVESLDFINIQNQILSTFKYSSFLNNSFLLGNFQYFLFSASKKPNYFTANLNEIHFRMADLVKEMSKSMIKNEDKTFVNSDFFHLFAEESNDLLFTLDNQGTFTFINEYGLKQLKYSNEEIIGKHFFEIITDDYKIKVAEVFQKIINEKSKINFNTEIIPKVSIEQLYTIKLIPICKNGEVDLLLGIGNNISSKNIQKKKTEELLSKLKEANRINAIERDRAKQQISILSELNDLKNEFISNVSHELRTPLASIIGFSETVIDDTDLTVERAKEFNEVILTESKRLAKLINDVLDFSELENEKQQLQKSSNNIIDILRECIDIYENECKIKKIILTNKLPESDITIFGDKERLKKAFSYLLSNSVKFTQENGRITLIAKEFLKEVEIVISDTGIGISEQKVPLLFDKFSKVKRVGNNLPGAGFGLVTVKQIIDLHKGLIRVKSEVDKGTSFIIRLPKYSFN